MAKIECEVIRDLIPLVLDGAASDASTTLVSEHCRTCAECAAFAGGELPVIPQPDTAKGLRRFKKQLFGGALSVLLLGILGGVMLMDDFAMFYNFILFPAVGAAAYFLLKKWCWLSVAVTFLGVFLRYVFTSTEGFLLGAYSGALFGMICIFFVGLGLLIGWLLHWGIGKLRKGKLLWLKLLAIAASLTLIGCCCSATFSFTGNPITMLMARSLAENYIAEEYPHLDLRVTDVSYNFKFANYYVRVTSADSPDSAFIVITSNGMEVSMDTYEESVIKRQSMFSRLCDEYQAILDPILAQVPGLEKHTSYFFWHPGEEGETVDYGAFPLDAPLDRELLHKMSGELLVRTDTEEITPEHLAQLLKAAHETLKQHGWDAPSYSASIESSTRDWLYTESYTGEELDAMTLEELAEAIRQNNL